MGFARLVALGQSAVGRPIGRASHRRRSDRTAGSAGSAGLKHRGLGAAYRPTVAGTAMPQTRAERLAQRAAERRARVEKQATRVDDVGSTAAAREQQQDDYKRGLAQNRANREARERQEADQLRASEADFLQKFAPPPGLAAAAPSLRQQAVANCVEIKILRRVRAESSRRPPRHRRDACSTAWGCRFPTARRSQHARVAAEK